jgi:hypothetical protein
MWGIPGIEMDRCSVHCPDLQQRVPIRAGLGVRLCAQWAEMAAVGMLAHHWRHLRRCICFVNRATVSIIAQPHPFWTQIADY